MIGSLSSLSSSWSCACLGQGNGWLSTACWLRSIKMCCRGSRLQLLAAVFWVGGAWCVSAFCSRSQSTILRQQNYYHQHPTVCKMRDLYHLLYSYFKELSWLFTLAALAPKIGLPRWLSSKESTCNAGDTGSIPGSGKCPGEGNGNPLQCSCLESPQRSLGRNVVCGVSKQLDMT